MPSSTNPTPAEHLCALCASAAPNLCKTCRSIHYCSVDCQRIDWPTHKLVCKQLKNMNDSPSPDHVRAIYFPESGSGPQLVWLRVIDRQVTGEPGLKLKVDISSLDITAQCKAHLREWRVLKYSELLRRPIPHMTWIGCFTQEDGATRITGENNSSLAAIDRELPRCLSGPFVFYAIERNLDATDFRNLVDHLRWEDYRITHIIGPTKEFSGETIPAVMANCFGDTDICHQPAFAPYRLPTGALRQNNAALLHVPIGALVGIPLVVIKNDIPSLPWRGRMVRDPDDGTMIAPEANRLLPNIHPRMYKARPGSLIVTRMDKKPLLVIHVKALCKYCSEITKHVAYPNVRETTTNRALYDECFDKRWKALQAKATRDGFRAFWEVGKREAKEKLQERFKEIPSPYDV